ncbi:MAG: adenylosuccinate lyase [Metallosphaera yellowstonensis]|jgi:Adenylosuccinate lyase (EC 4.3.2.2)|uniref:Adenylosuccinate lyase n=1 Tax=Metallosphaera yellowstonensis MK1 TaxID=671065 RepID=H2C6U5_9CREN|nr:adenylosuccinate lyase [Metallosphaera yellowstonensis]EHP69522.1 adenylosuccinate lyase [Metallosphaera yellowstonensis MK1]
MDYVCPLDWRYGSEEMRKIFERESVLKYRIRVELALLNTLSELGYLPKTDVELVSRVASKVTPEEVDILEAKLGHDIMAMAVAIADKAGEAGRFVHFGATSYDIVDTAYALMLKDALSILKSKLVNALEELKDMALNYRDMIMVGRTHGQHALPITFGFKVANYLYELSRSLERIVETEKRVIRGKMSGAVGTMAAWGDKGILIEGATLKQLDLEPHFITTQVAPRDGFAELLSNLAILGSVLERFALEVRELMRPEIMELAEGVGGRVGSSTMPQKENPVTSEKICGLSRILRGLVVAQMENIPLWHERDLTNSSSERITISHGLLIIDEMLESFLELLKGLRVFPENMMRNLKLTKGTIMAESLMVRLTLKGLPRHKAHEIVSKLSREAWRSGRELYEVALNDPSIRSSFTPDELRTILDPSTYLGMYRQLIERTIAFYEKVKESSGVTV